MSPAMLEKIHRTHFGAGSYIRRGKVSLFWPWHLVSTCHYSDWVEIEILPNILTATVVEVTKAHFRVPGIPDRLRDT